MPEESESKIVSQPQIITNVPLVYANNVTVNMTQSDITVVFAANGKAAMSIAMSLPVAKFLREAVGNALTTYERKTDSKILDIKIVSEQLKTT